MSQLTQDAIHEAINAQVHEDGAQGVLTDWIVIAHVSNIAPEGHEISGYHVLLPNGELADHRAVGLLRVGDQFLMHGSIRNGEDDVE